MQQTASVKIQVYGLVQGVGFRYSTQRQALKFGLTGYVCNQPDGSVEIVACGHQHQIEQLRVWLQSGGPQGARVDREICQPYSLEKPLCEFSVRY